MRGGGLLRAYTLAIRTSLTPHSDASLAEGEAKALTLEYLRDVWLYDDESSRGIPTEMVVEVCRQLGNAHTVHTLEEVKKARVTSLQF